MYEIVVIMGPLKLLKQFEQRYKGVHPRTGEGTDREDYLGGDGAMGMLQIGRKHPLSLAWKTL
jgi:hypothetical protein